eukprot:3510933-Karenia_brevis.AAC.1
MLYNRLSPQLDKQQTPDQAGFRPEYSTDDHLYTMTILQQKASEWRLPIWCAAVDFRKAFDSIDHDSLWRALVAQGVDKSYICLLQALYRGQSAVIKTDRSSRAFNIERG